MPDPALIDRVDRAIRAELADTDTDTMPSSIGLMRDARFRAAAEAAVRVCSGALGSLEEQPRSHADGPSTERTAARMAWPKANSDRRRVLDALLDAGDYGATADELRLTLDLETAARRLTDLKAGGWVEERVEWVFVDRAESRGEWPPTPPEREPMPVRRNTARGCPAAVYVLTAAARERLSAAAVA